MRRLLIENNLKAYRPKPNDIRAENRQKRVIWAEKHEKWSFKNWAKIIFSDESDLFPFRTRNLVVRRKPETVVITPFEPDLRTNRTIKVWGYITAEGVGKLHLYEGRMDSVKYCDVLEKNLPSLYADLRRKRLTFMQDGATCHTSAYTKKQFFEKQKFLPLEWPPQSPDLNPIENLWSILKEGLWRRRSDIFNQKDTWKIAQELWHKIPEELIQKIYKSLSDRCSKVIRADGMRIKTR